MITRGYFYTYKSKQKTDGSHIEGAGTFTTKSIRPKPHWMIFDYALKFANEELGEDGSAVLVSLNRI